MKTMATRRRSIATEVEAPDSAPVGVDAVAVLDAQAGDEAGAVVAADAVDKVEEAPQPESQDEDMDSGDESGEESDEEDDSDASESSADPLNPAEWERKDMTEEEKYELAEKWVQETYGYAALPCYTPNDGVMAIINSITVDDDDEDEDPKFTQGDWVFIHAGPEYFDESLPKVCVPGTMNRDWIKHMRRVAEIKHPVRVIRRGDSHIKTMWGDEYLYVDANGEELCVHPGDLRLASGPDATRDFPDRVYEEGEQRETHEMLKEVVDTSNWRHQTEGKESVHWGTTKHSILTVLMDCETKRPGAHMGAMQILDKATEMGLKVPQGKTPKNSIVSGLHHLVHNQQLAENCSVGRYRLLQGPPVEFFINPAWEREAASGFDWETYEQALKDPYDLVKDLDAIDSADWEEKWAKEAAEEAAKQQADLAGVSADLAELGVSG